MSCCCCSGPEKGQPAAGISSWPILACKIRGTCKTGVVTLSIKKGVPNCPLCLTVFQPSSAFRDGFTKRLTWMENELGDSNMVPITQQHGAIDVLVRGSQARYEPFHSILPSLRMLAISIFPRYSSERALSPGEIRFSSMRVLRDTARFRGGFKRLLLEGVTFA